ncbi:MAG: GNAT family N-acetyltransferase [Frankiaceae bacterium]|jgi:ribosomal protein S18 acetylase RimI-like enzyme|nr:GNAT family N-acetyltransferase [Frankiaceae bacterium]
MSGLFATRAASADDGELLARATLENLNWSGPRFTAEDIAANAEFFHYYLPWPGDFDFGVVAEDDDGPVGVVWVKHFTAGDPGYGFVSPDIPELSIWVDADHRQRGIGEALLREIVTEARARGLAAISLSVEDGNPAVRLYQRQGFIPAGDGFDPGTLVLSL